MTDKPVELDQHLGMAQKTTDLRRLLAEVAANERTFRATQDALKAQLLAAPAIKFTDNGEVCIKASKVNGWFEVAARDTGPGISHPDQVKLFHEFQQADSSITREQGARPRGLAISKRIIEIHGRRIWVEIKGGAQLEGFLSGFRS
jgi:signal transduction histidine kinase